MLDELHRVPTLPHPPGWRPPPTPPMPDVGGRGRRRRRVAAAVVVPAIAMALVVTLEVRSASTEIPVVRAVSTAHAPPTRLAIDKMTEALLWTSGDGERGEFVRQDIQRVMECAPVASVHEEFDPRDRGAVAAFRHDRRQMLDELASAEGFLAGDAERRTGPHGVERLSIAWRCASS
jgi:hypothetical protein